MKKVFTFLAGLAIGSYMLVERMGSPSLWVAVGVLCFWFLILSVDIYNHRRQVVDFFKRLVTFSFVRQGVLPVKEHAPLRATPDRVALIASYVLLGALALTSGAGVFVYVKNGVMDNHTVRVAMSFIVLLLLGLSLFRRRRKFLGKVRKLVRR